ncbi:MAG: SGNH/GDSL hydrolase family protein [Actinocatenispora sp.]
MKKFVRRPRTLAVAAVLVAAVLGAVGATASHAESHTPVASHHSADAWAGTWATSPTAAGAGASKNGFENQSVRMIVHTSIGGHGVRIRLSDAFGLQPLQIGHATVALPKGTPSGIDPATVHELTFSGHQSVTIPRGGQVLSDPLRMNVPALHDLAVTIFLPAATGPATWHWTARETTFLADGDHATDADGGSFTPASGTSWFFLTGVDVLSSHAAGDVVVLGDSITDGNGSTIDGNKRWPDQLAARVAGRQVGVLNAGLAGARLSYDGADVGFPEVGPNALARLDRDVFGQTNVDTVIVQLGINDINATPFEDAPTVIDGLKQVATQLHQKGLRVVVTTLTPYENSSGWTADKDAAREQVNSYLRGTHDFDAVLDFDRVVRDPGHPSQLLPSLDSGDHIHPNDTGYGKLAASVPLGLLS